MSGRKARSKKQSVPVPIADEPLPEEPHPYDAHDVHMEVVQDMSMHHDMVMEEGRHEEGVDDELDPSNRKTKKKKKPAYAFFVTDNRKQVSLDNPELSFGATTQKLAALWRNMSEADRAPYEEKAELEARQLDYADNSGNMSSEEGPKKRGRKRKERKWTKDPSAPKKAMTPYIVFGKAVRETVTAEMKVQNPAVKPTEIMREISERWGKLSVEERAPYDAEASKDKERYEAEKKAWMDGQGDQRTTIKKAKAVSPAERTGEPSTPARKSFFVRARGEADIYDKVLVPMPVLYKTLIKRIQAKRSENRPIVEIICLPNHRVRDQDDVDSLQEGQHLEVAFEGDI